MKISKLTENIGAEVTDVNLKQEINRDTKERLNQALTDNIVLVIRDQEFKPAEYLAAVSVFGEPMEQHFTQYQLKETPLVNYVSNRDAYRGGTKLVVRGAGWHTDHTNHERPPKYTALYAVNLPTFGGDTSFANMHSAYASLPKGEQSYLRQLQTVNKIEDFGYISEEAQIKFGSLPIHPLIRTHPETGKRAIYVHPGKVERIIGQETEESQAFIRNLLERVITPENTYRHQWQLGDLLICDNRAVLHKAHKDYDMSEGRVMHRIILRGDRPA